MTNHAENAARGVDAVAASLRAMALEDRDAASEVLRSLDLDELRWAAGALLGLVDVAITTPDPDRRRDNLRAIARELDGDAPVAAVEVIVAQHLAEMGGAA